MRGKFWFGILVVIALIGMAMNCRDPRQAQAPASDGVAMLEITCNSDSFALIQTRPHEDIYLDASLRMGKQTWKHARLRLRGDSSRDFLKKSLKLKLPKGPNLPFGRSTLNLNAEYLDRSYIRQHLCTRIFQRAGHPCYDTRHVQVRLNGKYYGIYLLVESVEDNFLQKWQLPANGDLFKATKDSACLSHHDVVRAYWERKNPAKDTSFTPIDSLIALLHDTPAATFEAMIRKHFDYDLLVNALAVNMLIGNRSTYYHNYFLYRHPVTRKWCYLPWDMDNTMLLAEINDLYHRGNNSDTHWSDMASNPLLERSLADPKILADVAKRVDALAADAFSPAYLFPLIDSVAHALAPYIPADTLFHHHTLARWQAEIAEVKQYIQQRPAVLRNQFSYCPTSFQLVEVEAPLHPGDRLHWHPSTDPQQVAIQYRIAISKDKLYETGTTYRAKGLADTSFVIPPQLGPGLYYWKVYATNGRYETRGFDNRSTFVIPAK